jgi:hypothetical protein
MNPKKNYSVPRMANARRVSKKELDQYAEIFPEYTRESVRKVLAMQTRPDAITTAYLLRPKRLGGKGLGKPNRRKGTRNTPTKNPTRILIIVRSNP